MIMKKVFLIPIYCIITETLFSQNIQKYDLYSSLFLDSLGNQYQIKKSYYHLPTSEDSILFYKESNIEIYKMMDSSFEEQKKYQSSLKKKKTKKKNKK
jgi:hypothetical protein